MSELDTPATHLYPGARLHVVSRGETSEAILRFGDGVSVAAGLAGSELTLEPYRTPAGTGIGRKRWAVEETGAGPIPVRTLEALLAEAGITRIDGLKIDIEGHEDKALAPFLDTAPRSMLPRRIVIEHPEPGADYPGCAAAFARHGYELVGRTRNNSLYRREHD